MRCVRLRRVLVVVVVGLCFLPAALHSQQAVSHVRVVRLSYVSGAVALKRPGSTEWTRALVNTPIQEGFELSTPARSFAEVEFENGSTARVGELSKLDFSQLALDADGNKLNGLTFEEGYATFHLAPEGHDVYRVKIADATLTPNGKSEFRTDFMGGQIRVEVFSGSVGVAAPRGLVYLGKDKVLEYNPGVAGEAFNTQRGIESDDWDKWVAARDAQAERAWNDQPGPSQGVISGWTDLDAYGEWVRIPGYGLGWSPYEPAGWSPYSQGMWGWNSGMGWNWISSDPWGWLPYQCGGWGFDDSFGWFWQMPWGGCFGWQGPLVNWYGGPGWIGWAPKPLPGGPRPHPATGGPLPRRPLPNAEALRSVITVPTNVFENGRIITPQEVGHVEPAKGTAIAGPPFQPTLEATLGEVPVTAGPKPAPHGPSSSRMIHGAAAPPTILMGGDPAKEKALLSDHRSFLARLRGGGPAREPLRARAGSTLGGRYPVDGNVGEFRGEIFRPGSGASTYHGVSGPRASKSGRGSSGGPVVVSHTSSGGGSSGARGGGGGGGGHSSGGGGFSVSSGGGGGGGHSSGGGGGGGVGGHH